MTYPHDPAVAIEIKAIDAALVVVCFSATGQRSAMVLQTAQALLILAIHNARTPGGPAACGLGAQRIK
jgi:hypothetical protein